MNNLMNQAAANKIDLPIDVTVRSAQAAGTDAGLKKDSVTKAGVTIMAVSAAAPAMCIGGSIGFIMEGAGRAVPLAFLLATIAIVLAAVSYARLSERYNCTGGTYSYIECVFGAKAGFWTGWLYIGLIVVLGAIGSIFATFLNSLFPFIPLWACILVILTPTFLLGWFGVESTTKALVVVWLLQLVMMIAPAIFAIVAVAGYRPDFLQTAIASGWKPEFGLNGLVSAALLCIWSYVGFETPSYMGEELKGGSKSIRFAVLVSSIAIGAIYVVLTWLWVASMDDSAFNLSLGSNTALSNYVALFNRPVLTWLVSLATMMSCFGCYLGFVTAMPRMLYDMGKNGYLPKRFTSLNKHQAPGFNVILTIAIWYGGALFGAYISIDVLLNYLAILACMAYAFISFANFKDYLRDRGIKALIQSKIIPISAFGILVYMILTMEAFYQISALIWSIIGLAIVFLMRSKLPSRKALEAERLIKTQNAENEQAADEFPGVT
jgi:amino acid transporter